MNNYIKYKIALALIITVGIYKCNDDYGSKNSSIIKTGQDYALSLAESVALGGAVGAAEVAMPGQMLSYAMNCTIKGEPFVLSRSYAGFTANALGQMPITAIQKVIQIIGGQQLEKWQNCSLSEKQKIVLSYLAGISGALVDTPSNAVQLFLQSPANSGKTTYQAMKELGAKSFRGFGPNSFIKEGPFAVGYQYLAPKGKGVVEKYIDNDRVATALGGSAAGVVTAVVTQPGAVIRNKMQGDLLTAGLTYPTYWQTVQSIIKKEGAVGFFKGLKARGARVAIAVPLYVYYTTVLENKIKNR